MASTLAAAALCVATSCSADDGDDASNGDAADASTGGGTSAATSTSTAGDPTSGATASASGGPTASSTGTATSGDTSGSSADTSGSSGNTTGNPTDTGAADAGSDSTGAAGSTGQMLDRYACDGYFFAACSFCLQLECSTALDSCIGVEGCCCVANCIAGGLDGQVCAIECGLDGVPREAEGLVECKELECDPGGECG